MHANNANLQFRRLECSISSTQGRRTRTVYTRSYNSLSLVIFYFIIFIIMPAFMIIAAVINIHNVILVLFSISTCAISFIILLRFVYYFYIIGIFAHILSICFVIDSRKGRCPNNEMKIS